MNVCAIVPSHNHHRVIADVVHRLRLAGLPVFVVDDGSSDPAAGVIAALHDPQQGITVHRLDCNQGKGAAVGVGFRLAWEAGFTHAVQVDADGQHDLDALPTLLEQAQAYPTALITGQPIYDDSIPTGRKIGRWITHVWVWIETLSTQIRDSMCGFRVYPLSQVQDLLARQSVGRRMDFDTDIMVRLFWRGCRVISVPVRVVYPPDNTSNFHMVRDNLRISWMHSRLVFRMLGQLLQRAMGLRGDRPPTHWAGLAERGAYWGLMICRLAYALLGRRGCLWVMAPIVGWFFVFGAEQRRASRSFLGRVFNRPATLAQQYAHFRAFAARALDTFIGWSGGIGRDAVVAATPGDVDRVASDPQGALIVIAHMGNVDLARALLDRATRDRMVVLVHTRHAQNYNRVVRDFCPDAALNLLEVSEIGPDTAIMLKERVEAGDWVVIAGDRTPIGSNGRVDRVPFLGGEAPFSQGPWILAAILGCPVHLLFCLETAGRWHLFLEPFADRISLPRPDRQAVLRECAARYAQRLEHYARQYPYQWFNFFDFWAG